MRLQANVAIRPQNSGMGGYRLWMLGQVSIHDLHAIEYDLNLGTLGSDFHAVPLTGGFDVATRSSHNAINRAAVLERLELGVTGILIVQNLDFDPLIGRGTNVGCSDQEPGVPTGLELVFQGNLEV